MLGKSPTLLKNPPDTLSFAEFCKSCKQILFMLNDAIRPTPTQIVLDYITKDSRVLILTDALLTVPPIV